MSRDTIRARVAAATEGPWYSEPETELLSARVGAEGHRRGVGDYAFAFLDDTVRPEQGGAEWDGPFIAHARQDIPAMLAVADAAAEMLDEVMCHATSGGTEGKWCIEHDVPMTGANQCFTSDRWRAALAALEALP